MYRRIVAVFVCLTMVFGLIVIIDVTVDFSLNVGGTTLYVNTTGSGGAYTKIQDAINDSKDGDMVFVYNGTYYENVKLNKSINLTGEDWKNTTIDAGGSGDVVFVNASWVNITGFTITNGASGIRFVSLSNNSLRGNNISDNLYGIYLSYSSNNIITGNNISYNDIHGIYLYPDSNYNTFTNNTVSNNDDDGFFIDDSISNHIFNNTVCNNGGGGIYLMSSSKVNTIYKNILYNNSAGIYLRFQCTGNNIFDNLVYNNTGDGIYLQSYCIGNKFINNTVYNNNDGICLYASDGNTIHQNRIYENRLNGIHLTYDTTDGSANNKITNNSILKNKGDGLHFTSRSNSNTIANNTIENNEDNGIYFYYSKWNPTTNNSICHNTNDGIKYEDESSGNPISENTVSDNGGYGIYLQNSFNNKIYHNDFIHNTNQAFDDTDRNKWNVSYPSGGNYWSDFDEPGEGAYDDYKGAGQNISGGDGIVDKGLALGGGKNPYIIDSNSQDNYPLIQPYIGKPLYLQQGWNLISLPSIQSNISLISVLQSIDGKYDAVQWYNVSDQTDFWKHCHISKPSHLNDLNEITHKIGFWIHITTSGETVFSYSGTKPIQNQTIYLYPGWNMVGYPSLTSYNRTEGLNNLTFGQDVDLIQWYNASAKTWHDLGENDYFVPGRGYWIHAKVDCEWEVPL